jgi:hypothetical protein
MSINVRVGNQDWVCIGVNCISGGCANDASSCRLLQTCSPGSRLPDLTYQDFVGQDVPESFRGWEENGMNASQLEARLRSRLRSVGGGTLGDTLVGHFMRGSQADRIHGPGSELSNRTRGLEVFRSARSGILRLLNQRLAGQVFGGSRREYDCQLPAQDMPWVSFSYSPLPECSLVLPQGSILPRLRCTERTENMLAAVIGDTKGIRVFLRNLSVTVSGRSARVAFQLRVELCDHFGADNGDFYMSGLRALWFLQHARLGSQRPFVNVIVVEEPGSLEISSTT